MISCTTCEYTSCLCKNCVLKNHNHDHSLFGCYIECCESAALPNLDCLISESDNIDIQFPEPYFYPIRISGVLQNRYLIKTAVESIMHHLDRTTINAFQVTKDGRYVLGCIDRDVYGWIRFPYRVTSENIVPVIQRFLNARYTKRVVDGKYAYAGFLIEAVPRINVHRYNGIYEPYYAIFSVRTYTCIYSEPLETKEINTENIHETDAVNGSVVEYHTPQSQQKCPIIHKKEENPVLEIVTKIDKEDIGTVLNILKRLLTVEHFGYYCTKGRSCYLSTGDKCPNGFIELPVDAEQENIYNFLLKAKKVGQTHCCVSIGNHNGDNQMIVFSPVSTKQYQL